MNKLGILVGIVFFLLGVIATEFLFLKSVDLKSRKSSAANCVALPTPTPLFQGRFSKDAEAVHQSFLKSGFIDQITHFGYQKDQKIIFQTSQEGVILENTKGSGKNSGFRSLTIGDVNRKKIVTIMVSIDNSKSSELVIAKKTSPEIIITVDKLAINQKVTLQVGTSLVAGKMTEGVYIYVE